MADIPDPNSAGEARHTDLAAAEVLERAAARLEKPGAWTKGSAARNTEGRSVTPRNPTAVCWCAIGAIYIESIPLSSVESFGKQAIDWLSDRVGSVPDWNDAPGRTQSEVVAELRAAAADLRGAA